MAELFLGTSGFYYSSWVGQFYPTGLPVPDRLPYYADNFNSVEINSTFYAVPREKAVKHWKESVPDSFCFSFKAPKAVTHDGDFSWGDELKAFFMAINDLAGIAVKHLILFQTPPMFGADPSRFEALLAALPKQFRYAFEFRHSTWFSPLIIDLAKRYGAALVMADSPSRNGKYMWPRHNVETADFAYFRLHGSQSLYASAYSEEELQRYAAEIMRKIANGIDVYCYFNNTRQGAAIPNTRRLRELVSDRS